MVELKKGMSQQEILNKISKNRDEIERFLNSDVPLSIIKFNIKRLSMRNEKLIKLLKKS